MSSATDHRALPRSDRTRFPWRFLLHGLRPVSRGLVGRRYEVHVHGADLVPASGPVIFAANHVGVMDGPLLAMFAPRPVHALTKVEMFRGPVGRFLLFSGQIPLDRFRSDPGAVKACLRVLRDGATMGIFPEGQRGTGELERFHRGAAYFALVSGAPVVPVVFFGTRDPGGTSGSLPHRGARIDIVLGAPYTVPAAPWPRTKEQVEHTSMLLREHLLVHLDHAKALTGRTLPGPLPAGDSDPDPATGVTDQGAP
ncbi:lysophospholipid acyltransferase family protein [Nocardioides pantholopis]|uniref:lysophospholipid acyltransferase family protein n=1 Tax=Nocardioides pantholopis TaxID=2483798 RepID=UPI000FDB5594|nr:lysophospholipid acyltransferase family protein [Nocardioides pantholopis]